MQEALNTGEPGSIPSTKGIIASRAAELEVFLESPMAEHCNIILTF